MIYMGVPKKCGKQEEIVKTLWFFVKEVNDQFVPFFISPDCVFLCLVNEHPLFMHYILHPPVQRCHQPYMQGIRHLLRY